MKESRDDSVSRIGPYRVVNLSKMIDPLVETRRCKLNRYKVMVQGVEDYHTDIDITSHLGTHVEAPYHHADLETDVAGLLFTRYLGRGVLLKLTTCKEKALIKEYDLEIADQNRIREDDIVILDSCYHSEPFAQEPNDKRPHLSREASNWMKKKRVKAVGIGDGVCIESNIEHCNASHDILLKENILILEVLKNIDKLLDDIFLIIYMPILIRGLDSSPINVIAIEGIEGFR